MISVGRAPWMEPQRRLETIAKAIVLTLIVIVVVYPFMTVLATSLATEQDVDAGGGFVLIPPHPTLDAYREILSGGVITHAIVVSIAVTVIGTISSLIITIMMAYGLSRPTVIGRPVLAAALFTLLFTPGIIPNYLMVKQLGLLNNYASLILPVLMNAFNLVVIRQFFMDIPQELIDAARMDGAGDLRILLHVVLPLSKAVVAVITLFYAVAYWNSFFTALLYLSNAAQWPLSLVLRLYVLQGSSLAGVAGMQSEVAPPQQAMRMAVVIIATVPILVVYPFVQKYFTAGVLRGAVKG